MKLSATVLVWTTFSELRDPRVPCAPVLYQLLQWQIQNFPQGKPIVWPIFPENSMKMKETGPGLTFSFAFSPLLVQTNPKIGSRIYFTGSFRVSLSSDWGFPQDLAIL